MEPMPGTEPHADAHAGIRPLAAIASYHVHVYYDGAAARARAHWLRERLAERFLVRLGRWHDAAVGPHPQPMFQVAFLPTLFATLVPWLMQNRRGLTMLVHPNTGAPRDDHMVHALWLGAVLPITADVLPIAQDIAVMETEPNTQPHIARA